MDSSTVDLDLRKQVLRVDGVDATGLVMVRRKLQRAELLGFFAALPQCIAGMKACAAAHHQARQIDALGHEKHLVPKAAS